MAPARHLRHHRLRCSSYMCQLCLIISINAALAFTSSTSCSFRPVAFAYACMYWVISVSAGQSVIPCGAINRVVPSRTRQHIICIGAGEVGQAKTGGSMNPSSKVSRVILRSMAMLLSR
jgi:hypothetical protein